MLRASFAVILRAQPEGSHALRRSPLLKRPVFFLGWAGPVETLHCVQGDREELKASCTVILRAQPEGSHALRRSPLLKRQAFVLFAAGPVETLHCVQGDREELKASCTVILRATFTVILRAKPEGSHALRRSPLLKRPVFFLGGAGPVETLHCVQGDREELKASCTVILRTTFAVTLRLLFCHPEGEARRISRLEAEPSIKTPGVLSGRGRAGRDPSLRSG